MLGAYACNTITVICSNLQASALSPISRIDAASVVISRPWSRDSSALEFILSRSRSRELMTKVSILVSRPEGPGLGLGLKT